VTSRIDDGFHCAALNLRLRPVIELRAGHFGRQRHTAKFCTFVSALFQELTTRKARLWTPGPTLARRYRPGTSRKSPPVHFLKTVQYLSFVRLTPFSHRSSRLRRSMLGLLCRF
jgi:hypothetical protein